MKASGRQEFVISKPSSAPFEVTWLKNVILLRAWCPTMSGKYVTDASYPTYLATDSNVPGLQKFWTFLDFIYSTGYSMIKCSINVVFGCCAYQTIHFGVGNVVGLLGSYLKWTNKMSALFSHILIWGSDSIITLTLCQLTTIIQISFWHEMI